jgi:DNA-directed RNA polymerase I subunit RPA49
MDSCIEAFGTTKQKRSLNSRRMNKVGSESLNLAVAKAAEDIIDTKGVNGKLLELGAKMCPERYFLFS